MTAVWPWHYGGLEPLNKQRRDSHRRYAAAFQLVPFEDNTQDLEKLSIARESELVDARSNAAFPE